MRKFGVLARWGPTQAVLLESSTECYCGGCGWIQVIQDRLFPSVRPILDYLFLEAADDLPDEDGSWTKCAFLPGRLGLGLLSQQKPGNLVELSVAGQRSQGLDIGG